MALSVFIEFQGSFPSGDWVKIFNADMAVKQLSELVKRNNFEVLGNDLWNDFGWYLNVANGNEKITIFLAKYEANEKWQCIIEPIGQPTFFMKLFGKKETQYLNSLKNLVLVVEQWLKSSAHIYDFEFSLSNNPKYATDEAMKLKW